MRVTFIAEMSLEEGDGFDGCTAHTREGIVDLVDMSQFLAQSVQGAGYTYVDDVGFRSQYKDMAGQDKIKETWGGF